MTDPTPVPVAARDPLAAFRLDGRTVIMTGASSGIGRHLCATYAAAGATVVAAARRAERLDELAAEIPGLVPVPTDVTDDDALRHLVARAVEATGRIDVVVNNAGGSDAPSRVEEQDPASFRRVVELNLNACFVLASLSGARMIEQGHGGSIVNIASVHGIVGSSPNNQAGYVATKTGLIGLTKELALQWARHDIRVNALAPGYFRTELTEVMLDDDGGDAWIKRNTPMRRPGELAELDGAALLLSSDAGRYLTGQTVAVDGGWTAR